MGGPRPQLDSQALVYHVDLFLFSLIAIIVLFRLPRFVARLWRFSEWSTGHRLGKKTLAEHPTRRVTFHESSPDGNGPPPPPDLSTNDNHTLTMEQYTTAGAERVSEKGNPVQLAYPPHVPATTSLRLFQPVAKVFKSRISSGRSALHGCIMVTYLSVLAFPAFYHTNLFTDPVRFGWITVSQLPFVFLFATKNNLLGLLMGAGYEKVSRFSPIHICSGPRFADMGAYSKSSTFCTGS